MAMIVQMTESHEDVIRDGVCWVGPDAEFRSETETVSASYDLNLDFLVLDGITGNVVVKESESFDTEDVRINVVMYATTTKLLDQLQHSIVRDTPNIAHARVHINDQMDKDAKKKLLRGGCARADVEIIYPRSNPGTGKLSIVATNGELLMKMSPKHTRASFEEVKLSLSNGDVNVDNVVVSKTFLAEVANGNVNGGIRSAGKVTVNTVNGPVTLKIDAAPLNQSWGESKLVVDIYTVNGLIGLDLVQRFLGHFDLVNANGNKAIRLASDSKDIITYSAQGSKQLTGWISQDGVEPASPSPRLTLLNVNGAIKLNVETMT
ncbi:hypothetical protein BGZ58_007924 [Dissophora ornata]|nr:hypothetical protein BGZ58_007924 [Dissophora ornata]